jgi:hypothetical protein
MPSVFGAVHILDYQMRVWQLMMTTNNKLKVSILFQNVEHKSLQPNYTEKYNYRRNRNWFGTVIKSGQKMRSSLEWRWNLCQTVYCARDGWIVFQHTLEEIQF